MTTIPPTLPRPTAVLWDMDGTLVDQTAGILRCYREVVRDLGHPEPDETTIRRSMGGPMPQTMGLLVPPEEITEACRRFRARFPGIMFDGMVVLPGGPELVERLFKARIPQAILTNKHGETARQVARYAGFARYIPLCIGNGDTDYEKPQAELTREILRRLDVPARGACLIGDSPTDITTARNAGLAAYTVATGAHSLRELQAATPDATFPNLEQFAKALPLGK